jgi:aldehyde:ferredoxin oxidoreductase
MNNLDVPGEILYIDLGKKVSWTINRNELFQRSLGGAGVAIHLLTEECPEGCNPLGSENVIVFAVGPLTGFFPLASKTVAMFKSPLTGNLGESHCGGRSAIAIRMAGYGAIVIKGKSEIPIYLSVHDKKVYFRDARTLWGMSSSFTVGRIIRENEPGAGLRTIMRIGRAGENLVSYACVTTETYRHFGRLGLGAVFGSKNLKALVISGKRSFQIAEKKLYRSAYDEIYQASVNSEVMKKYHDLGTAENVSPLNTLGGLPTKNLKDTRFAGADSISGELLAEKYLGRRLACSHCPVGCIHIAALREPYEDESYFYKTSMISYDYEPIYAIGSMLGIDNPEGFLKLMDRVEAVGIDVMSTGVILAWSTEALEKEIIGDKETMGLKLNWGDYKSYIKAVKYIVEQPNDFFHALSKGVDYAASQYGGKDFALAFGKNEMPGYHTGPAAHAGVLIGARHSHLDNAGYSIDQKKLMKGKMEPEELAQALIAEEQWRQILSGLVVCFFARGIYTKERVLKCLGLVGFNLNEQDLTRIGKEIYSNKFRYKFREGFSFSHLAIPKRITETPSPVSQIDEQYIKKTIKSCESIIMKE